MPRPPNSGRKKGTPNKKTVEFQKFLEQNNFSPAEALLQSYKDARAIFERRLKYNNLTGALDALNLATRAAENMAEYIYPKRKAVEHSGEVKTITEWLAEPDDAE